MSLEYLSVWTVSNRTSIRVLLCFLLFICTFEFYSYITYTFPHRFGISNNFSQCEKACAQVKNNMNLFIKVVNDIDTEVDIADVFLFYSDRNVGADHDFILKGHWWVGAKLMKHLSKNDLRIHIITDNTQILKEIETSGFPFYGYNLKYFDHLNTSFHALYKHISVNTITYEYLCFYRWLVINEIVVSWSVHSNTPMQKIITMDLDVVILANPNTFFTDVFAKFKMNYHKSNFIILIPGGLILWSPLALNQFKEYLINWYNRNYEEIKLSTTEAAHDIINNQTHFSDMYMLINNCNINLENCTHLRSESIMIGEHSSNQCLATSNIYRNIANNISVQNSALGRNIVINTHNTSSLICFIHFQGNSKSLMKKLINEKNYMYTSAYTLIK